MSRLCHSAPGWPLLILDANAIRAVLIDGLSIEPFLAFSREGGTVHIADGSIVEFLSWLHSDAAAWPAWVRGRERFHSILDEEWPVMIGGGELLAQAGLRLDRQQSRYEPEVQYGINRAIWDGIRTARTLDELRRLRRPYDHGRGLILFDAPGATKQVSRTKEEWVDKFRRYAEAADAEDFAIKGKVVPERLLEDAVVRLAAFLDAHASSIPAASVRLDAMIRVHLLLSYRSLKTKESYNAEKDSNDAFDFELYRYLAVPAAVCTSDRGVANDLRAAGAWQVDWVVTPQELADPTRRQRLLSLAWPIAP